MTSVGFMGITGLLLTLSAGMPEWDTESELFRRVYYRGDEIFNTTVFPIDSLFFYFSMNLLGVAYVNVSNLNFVRNSFFLSNHMWYRDFWKTVIFAPILFMISSIMMIRSRNNIESKTYTTSEVMFFNSWWSFFYLIGLQYTHLKQGILNDFIWNPEHMKNWPPILWALCLFIWTLFISLIVYLCPEYNYLGIAKYYGIYALVLMISFILVTIWRKKTHNFHMHHYTFSMFILSVIGY